MWSLNYTWPIDSRARLRPVLREVAAIPCPAVGGLFARHWRIDRGRLRGCYLFRDYPTLAAFRRAPACDPAFARLAELASDRPVPETRECRLDGGVIDRPLIILAAPRAGGTLLYEVLARSEQLWTVDGESEGLIEGVPALHPANRGFHSHRLTELDADSETVAVVHAGFLANLRDCRGRAFLDSDGRTRGVRVLEKTAENCLRVPFLAAVFPTARFVFLHRDARQNVSSIIEAWRHDGFINIPDLPGWKRRAWHLLLPEGWREFNHATHLEIAAFQWSAANERVMDDLAAVPRNRWISVEYAELVAAPGAAVRRICDFAELEIDASLAAVLARPLPMSSTTTSPPSSLKWRRNPLFHEAALNRYSRAMARVRDCGHPSAPPPPARPLSSPVRFACFLDDIRPHAGPDRADLMVTPSFRFQFGPTVPLGLLRRTRFRERFRADFPLVWHEDPTTRVFYPIWVARQHVALFRQFAAGECPPEALDDVLAAKLIEAGILVPRDDDGRRRAGEALVARARPDFAEHRYCVLPGLLAEAHVLALGVYYRDLIAHGAWAPGDAQVVRRYGYHNEPVARYFHHQLIDFIGRVAGEPVKPSYAYVSAYQEAAVLQPHVDRKQCVFTLSLWVDHQLETKRQPWPLWFETDQGPVALTQAAGDAVLFRGCELPHWRHQPPPGAASTTLIFHYVPANFVGVLE